jgi:hypothetical protein
MSGAAFLRMKKLKGGWKTLSAARHNRREIQRECGASASIDPTRSHLNETLIGPPTAYDVPQLAKERMRNAGIDRLRKDAVTGIEIVFSLPATFTLDATSYFKDCVTWAAGEFGGMDNILSADIHRDEAMPHCHVLILPLLDGRMVGSDMMGNKKTLAARHASFNRDVGARYGLATARKRFTGHMRTECAKAVIQHLRTCHDPSLKSLLWPVYREAIERDPTPAMLSLGLEAPAQKRKLKTMAQTFTSKGKGPKRESPIGFEAPKNDRTLSCVGFAAETEFEGTGYEQATTQD